MNASAFDDAASPPRKNGHEATGNAVGGRLARRGGSGRGDALDAMYRDLRPGALPSLINLLRRLVDGEAALLDGAGRLLAGGVDKDVFDQLADPIALVAGRRAQAAATDVGARRAEVLAVGESAPHAVLVVVRDQPFTPAVHTLALDGGRLLWLLWRMDTLAAEEHRLGQAEGHVRQAVLQLLMSGEVSAARRTAGALTPPLPDTVRVYIMECASDRDQVAAQCAQAARGRAWIVRCPVYREHLIILAPTAEPQRDTVQTALRTVAGARADVRLGISHGIGLPQTPLGYQQAMHALAVARATPGRAAQFTASAELAEALGPEAPPWAVRTLRPLLEHRPERQGDPDAEELITTLDLWISFGPGAAALLAIHRNTLGRRLRHLELLLGRNLTPLGAQAELNLALRLLRLRIARQVISPADALTDADLDSMLASREAAVWADLQLAPLLDPANEPLLRTVRAWLENNTLLDPAAGALGISVPGVRKRLGRVEQLLQRSLLTRPSCAGDLWLALRSQALRPTEADR